MSHRYTVEHFMQSVKKQENGCWLWEGKLDKSGYGMAESKWLKIKRAHRMSYYFHIGEFNRELGVLHKCDTPSCVNPDHLFLGTQQDNNLDKMHKGRYKKGSDIVHSKLTEHQVSEIKAKYIKGEYGYAAISREYGVAATTIRSIINNIMWKHVK